MNFRPLFLSNWNRGWETLHPLYLFYQTYVVQWYFVVPVYSLPLIPNVFEIVSVYILERIHIALHHRIQIESILAGVHTIHPILTNCFHMVLRPPYNIKAHSLYCWRRIIPVFEFLVPNCIHIRPFKNYNGYSEYKRIFIISTNIRHIICIWNCRGNNGFPTFPQTRLFSVFWLDRSVNNKL